MLGPFQVGAILGFVALPGGALIGDHYGWRTAFFLLAIQGFVLATLAWRLPEPERARRTQRPLRSTFLLLLPLLGLGGLVVLVLGPRFLDRDTEQMQRQLSGQDDPEDPDPEDQDPADLADPRTRRTRTRRTPRSTAVPAERPGSERGRRAPVSPGPRDSARSVGWSLSSGGSRPGAGSASGTPRR